MNITEKINAFKKEIDKKKSEKSQLVGRLEALNSQLQEEGFSSTQEAIKELNEWKTKISVYDVDIEEGWKEIEKEIKEIGEKNES